MATLVNQSTAAQEAVAPGVVRQNLLRTEPGGVSISRVTLSPGANATLHVPKNAVAWLIAAEGEATAKTPYVTEAVSGTSSVFFAPGWDISISSERGCGVLAIEVADVKRLDPAFSEQMV